MVRPGLSKSYPEHVVTEGTAMVKAKTGACPKPTLQRILPEHDKHT